MACTIEKQQKIIKDLVKRKIETEQEILDIFNKHGVTVSNVMEAQEVLSEQSLSTFNSIITDYGIQLSEILEPAVTINRINKNRPINNIDCLFNSPIVSDLFHTLHIAEKYFLESSNALIMRATKLGDKDSSEFINDPVKLNQSLKNLKNRLFERIVRYLYTGGNLENGHLYFQKDKFIGNIYNKKGVINYTLYQPVISKFQDVIASDEDLVILPSGKEIPNLQGSISNGALRTKLDAYNAAIMLVNFDNILFTRYRNQIKVNFSEFNTFEDPIQGIKYTATTKGFETEYWAEDEHMSEAAETLSDDLTKNTIAIIPHYDHWGNPTGQFLETKHLYSLAATMHVFELENSIELFNDPTWKPFNEDPINMYEWYIKKVSQAKKQGFLGLDNKKFLIFRPKFDIIQSLSIFKNEIAKKETKTQPVTELLTQVLNNCYGAYYNTFNGNSSQMDVKELYSHNAEKIALQVSVYTHLKNLLNSPETFIFGKDRAKSLERIKKLTSTSSDLVKFIQRTLGISIKSFSAEELIKQWTTNNSSVEGKILDYLDAINNNDLLGRIAENEKSVNDDDRENVQSESKVITELNSKIQDILDVFLDNYVLTPITVISTYTGEKIPSFKTPTLFNNDIVTLKERFDFEKKETGNITYKSLLANNSILKGTGIKLELVNKGQSKSAFSFSVLENFISDFFYGFVNPFTRPEAESEVFPVIVGNYSDKNSILSKLFGLNASYDNKSIIGNRSGQNVLSEEALQDLVRTQSLNFFTDNLHEIIKQYKYLGLELNLTSPIAENLTKINEYLKQFEGKSDAFLEVIRQARLKNPDVNFQLERHYTFYGKRIAINQNIWDYYKIFSNKGNFNKFINKQFENAITKLQDEGKNELFSAEELDQLSNSTKRTKNSDADPEVITNLLQSLGINSENYNKSFVVDNEEENVHAFYDSKGNVNPILKRWLLATNLFKQEYHYLTLKGEYMHKTKGIALQEDYASTDYDKFSKNFENEAHWRIANMGKRNVVATAVIELPVHNKVTGVPNNINHATISDLQDELYNMAKTSHKQDIHDGSSVISYLYAKMVEESYPGKGYKGTKKQFGTFLTPYGIMIKKDAETVLTNDKIRNSKYSSIAFKNLQEKSLGLPININLFVKDGLNQYYWKDGSYFKISKLKIENNVLSLELLKYNNILQKFESIEYNPTKINTLYDLWTVFGGEYSTDSKFNLDESSNDLLFNIITSYNEEGNYVLKNRLIHIMSNLSAIKAGATNINPSTHWIDNTPLNYTTVSHKYMGPQLDANHTADASKIKEITQLISTLAQSPMTSQIANEVYQNLAQIIKEAASPYLKTLDSLDDKNLNDFYLNLSKEFAKDLNNSQTNDLSKIISESFGSGDMLPFSNQHFFGKFVQHMIGRLNSEFITRYYSGLGAILNPSHKIIQLFEDAEGNILKQEDIIKEAMQDSVERGIIGKNSEEIVKEYLDKKLKPIKTIVGKINPGEIVEIKGIRHNLSSPKLYQDFKEMYSNNEPCEKIINIPRDLKPSEITFDIITPIQVVVNTETTISTELRSYNLFDTDSIKLKFLLSRYKAGENILPDNKDFIILQNFLKAFNLTIVPNNKEAVDNFKEANHILDKWTERNLEFLNSSKLLPFVSEHTDFNAYFGTEAENGDDLKKINNDVLDFWLPKLVDVQNYVFKPNELILPNIYKTVFDNDGASIVEINKLGSKYFRNKLEKEFNVVDIHNSLTTNKGENITVVNPTKTFDLVLNLKSGQNPVFVKFVKELTGIVEPVNSFDLVPKVKDGKSYIEKTRLSNSGEKLYKKPENSEIKIGPDYDIVYIKIGDPIRIKETDTHSTVIYRDFKETVSDFINSFQGEISSIIPLMNNKINNVVKSNRDHTLTEYDLNSLSFSIFKNFTGYRESPKVLDNTWFINNKEGVLDTLSERVYASWQKSHQFIVSRIPAQSLQSAMEMKNIGYFSTESNDAYVSIWQIWIQGSDFDIDKAYIMGYGFNKSGQYDTWTNLSNYSTVEELNELEKFPLPSYKKYTFNDNGINLDQDILDFSKITNIPSDIEDLSDINLSLDEAKIIGNILRKLNQVDVIVIKNNINPYANLVLNLVNKHNSFKKFIYSKNAVKNSVIARIRQVISAPSSQFLSSIPVDVESLHDAAKNAGMDASYRNLSNWDMLSFYKQQKEAAVGKADVGIGANGLKVFLALTNYYNNWYKHLETQPEDLRLSNKAFLKTFNINGKSYNISSIADINISKEMTKELEDAFGLTKLNKQLDVLNNRAAVVVSNIISGATDNAKELVMAKINGITELLGTHLYLTSLGISIDEVVKYMNSPIVQYLIKGLNTNYFKDPKKLYINELLVSYETMLNNDKTKLIEELEKKYSQIIPKTEKETILISTQFDNEKKQLEASILQQFKDLETFHDIYEGAQEFKILASMLKVNQKIAANSIELNRFLTGFDQILWNREGAIFGQDAIKLRDSSTWDTSEQFRISLINRVIRQNPLLHEGEKDRGYVRDIFNLANNVEISFINSTGVEETKNVSLLGGQFDFRYYMHPKNENYRKITTSYYNLIKNTINIFDVIENSPHFKAMIDGVGIINNILLISSKKYNFIFSQMRDIIRTNSLNIQQYNKGAIKTWRGNPAFSINIDDVMIRRIINLYDKLAVASWLKNGEKAEALVFKVQDWLRLAGINSITLYRDDLAKISTSGALLVNPTVFDQGKVVTVKVTDPDYIIDLKTDTGIANFKRMVEVLGLQILKNEQNTDLGNILRLSTVKNSFNISTTQVTPTFPISSLNSTINLEKFQILLNQFNEIDQKCVKIPNVRGVNMQWKDLLYVYNLIVNNDSYGDKRLTPMFEDYIKNNNNIAGEYIKYSVAIDRGEAKLLDLLPIENPAIRIEIYRSKLNTLLFLTLNVRNKLTTGVNNNLSLVNGDYVINTEMDIVNNANLELTRNVDKLKNLINLKGLIINYNCI